MLILARKVGETIMIGDDVCVKVTKLTGSRVTLALDAPPGKKILRGEIERKADVGRADGERCFRFNCNGVLRSNPMAPVRAYCPACGWDELVDG